jgi:group I intron endonuclease
MKLYPFSGIYLMRLDSDPSKFYIGSSVNVYRRMIQHSNALAKNKHPNPKLQNFYNAHPKKKFTFNTLFFCQVQDLLKWEQFFLDYAKPYFNICPCADSRLGTFQSDSAKLKISRSWKNRSKNIFCKNLFTTC